MNESDAKTTLVFLPDDGEASLSLLTNLVYLLSGGTVQLESTYSRTIKVTGRAEESQ